MKGSMKRYLAVAILAAIAGACAVNAGSGDPKVNAATSNSRLYVSGTYQIEGYPFVSQKGRVFVVCDRITGATLYYWYYNGEFLGVIPPGKESCQ